MTYGWVLLAIGKRDMVTDNLTGSREYLENVANSFNRRAILSRSDTLFRVVPLPITGDIYTPQIVEYAR